jgi:ribosomal protein S1
MTESDVSAPEAPAAEIEFQHADAASYPGAEHVHQEPPPAHIVSEHAPETALSDALPEPVLVQVSPEPALEQVPVEPALAQAPAEPPAAGATDAAPAAKHSGPRTVGFDPSVEERKKRAQEHWERIVAAKDNGEVFTGVVSATIKGGLLVDVGGIRGFLPASQARVELGGSLETLVKSKVPLRVIEVDAKRRRIVVSHRRALDEERRTKRTELLRSLAIGQRHEGTVVRLAPFGAFADIGGIEGLIPMSELAFERVEKVTDVLSVGDRVEVTILRVEEGGKKIGLSRKNALPDPWRDSADLIRPGAVIEGKVVGKEPRLQVEIAPGVVGSVRESDADPAQYEIGEAIEVSIRGIDRRNRRITLTTLHGAEAAVVSRSTGFFTIGEELMRKAKR